MKALVTGRNHYKFTGDDGKITEGCKLFFVYQVDDVTGLGCGEAGVQPGSKLFHPIMSMSDKFPYMVDVDFSIKIGKNAKPKLSDITILEADAPETVACSPTWEVYAPLMIN